MDRKGINLPFPKVDRVLLINKFFPFIAIYVKIFFRQADLLLPTATDMQKLGLQNLLQRQKQLRFPIHQMSLVMLHLLKSALQLSRQMLSN
jgi:hypothetical protein